MDVIWIGLIGGILSGLAGAVVLRLAEHHRLSLAWPLVVPVVMVTSIVIAAAVGVVTSLTPVRDAASLALLAGSVWLVALSAIQILRLFAPVPRRAAGILGLYLGVTLVIDVAVAGVIVG